MENGTPSPQNNSVNARIGRRIGDVRDWLEWFGFLGLLILWVLGLVSGRNLHGFIHLFLLGAVCLLIVNIVSHGSHKEIATGQRDSATPR